MISDCDRQTVGTLKIFTDTNFHTSTVSTRSRVKSQESRVSVFGIARFSSIYAKKKFLKSYLNLFYSILIDILKL
jgi:hypothetical protein